jgi:hypothetical protein
MCEAVEIFRQALAEQGLDADVTHELDGYTTTFYVSKQIGADNLTFTTSITDAHITDYSEGKRIALAARKVAEKFTEELTQTFEIRGTHIKVMPYDEPEAKCLRCERNFGLPEWTPTIQKTAELSSPKPIPVNRERRVNELSEHSRILLKLYLAGRANELCDCDRKI